MNVSVIVPVHNAAATLGACLTALWAASPDEIIVVDDGSEDGGGAIAMGLGARVIEQPQRTGPAGARNAGAAAANGEILFFVDADVVVPSGAVARLKREFEADGQLAGVFGSYDRFPAAPGLVSQYRNLLHHFVHQQADEKSGSFWAGCGALRRSAFEAIGGFDASRYPQASIEDIELGGRLSRAGLPIRLLKDLQVTHLKNWTLSNVIATDIARRAVPWSLLLIAKGHTQDLNLRPHHRLSAAVVWLALLAAAAALAGFWRPIAVATLGACAVTLLALNASFYAFLFKERGMLFMARAVPLHWLYYAYSSATYAVLRLRALLYHSEFVDHA